MRWHLAGLVLLPGLLSCVGVTLRPHALDEAVRVEQVALAFTPKGAGTLTLLLAVDNPTAWDAQVAGVDYELRLDGRRYAVGTRGARLTLDSEQQHTFSLSFPLKSEPIEPETPSRSWHVEVSGGVALRFRDNTVRLLPFRTERFLRLEHFRPLAPVRE
jgi:hypothetical protein